MSKDSNILDASRLDESQRAFCQEPSSCVRLLAPAGSGKTLSVLWRCLALHEAAKPEHARFLIFTFTRAARDELRERLRTIPEFKPLKPYVQVATLNAWGYRRIKPRHTTLQLIAKRDQRFWTMVNVLQPLWRENDRLRAVLTDNRRKNRAGRDLMDLADRLKSVGFRHDQHDETEKFCAHALWLRDNGMGAHVLQMLRTLGDLEIVSPTPEEINAEALQQAFEHFGRFWCAACVQLYSSSILTLEDQKYWTLLDVEAAVNERRFTTGVHRVHHVIVDEFQDINPLDLALLKSVCGLNKAGMCIVGDDDQAIYEWRCATPEFILDPEKHIGASFQTFTLATNYRSPENIVRLSQRLIGHNQRRVAKDVKAHSTADAKIEVVGKKTIEESVEHVRALVHEMLADPEIGSVALIGRKRSQIIPYQIVFAGEGVEFFAAEDLHVSLCAAFKALKELLLLRYQASQPFPPGPDPVESLLKIVDRVKRYPLSKGDRESLKNHLIEQRPETLEQAVEALPGYNGSLKGQSSASFAEAIGNLLTSTTVADSLEAISQHFAGFRKDYGRSLDEIFYADPPFYYLADYARRYGSDFPKFYKDIDTAMATLAKIASNDDDDESESLAESRQSSLHLMTALRAKGKQFDAVVILDCNDGIWPSKLASSEAEFESERRLFYVAFTRARRRLVLVVNEEIMGEPAECSPYIAEAGLPVPTLSEEETLNRHFRYVTMLGLSKKQTNRRRIEKTIKEFRQKDLEAKKAWCQGDVKELMDLRTGAGRLIVGLDVPPATKVEVAKVFDLNLLDYGYDENGDPVKK